MPSRDDLAQLLVAAWLVRVDPIAKCVPVDEFTLAFHEAQEHLHVLQWHNMRLACASYTQLARLDQPRTDKKAFLELAGFHCLMPLESALSLSRGVHSNMAFASTALDRHTR
jgi:hypothetical protein